MKMMLAMILLILIKMLLIGVALVDRMTFGREAPLD